MAVNQGTYTALVRAVALREPVAEQALYDIFNRGMRFMIGRQLGGENLEDILHSAFIDVHQSIMERRINDPEKLIGFVRVVVQRKITSEIRRRVAARKSTVTLDHWTPVDTAPSAERVHSVNQEVQVAKDVLNGMKPREREVLQRFYLKEQSPGEIRGAMGLSEDQFRNIKHRAKAVFSAKITNLQKLASASMEGGSPASSNRI